LNFTIQLSVMKKFAFFFLSVTIISLFACKKTGTGNGNQQSPPKINSINPTSGPKGTVVTITGSGFSTTASNNDVSFNGVAAVVSNATANTLTVTVPDKAGTGNMTVSVNNSKVTGPVFNYISSIQVITFAGSGVGFADGTGTAAKFSLPYRATTDAQGNVYVSDYSNSRIRKISPAGDVTTLAGSGIDGFADGPGTAAQFSYPTGIGVDAQGNVYVADYNNHRIRKITATGVVSTLAGSDTAGNVDGTGSNAQFTNPTGLAADSQGNVYVTDPGTVSIRKISPGGVVSTLAGNGKPGFVEGAGSSAEFNEPLDAAVDGQGNVYVADYLNFRIRKISSAGVVSTLAGNGTSGYIDGVGTSAEIKAVYGLASDAAGNVYLADWGCERIRKISIAGVVSTLAGDGNIGMTDGLGASAEFNYPYGIAVDANGNIYVVDTANNRIRKITID
jgi:serine/threonine-protein kinase